MGLGLKIPMKELNRPFGASCNCHSLQYHLPPTFLAVSMFLGILTLSNLLSAMLMFLAKPMLFDLLSHADVFG